MARGDGIDRTSARNAKMTAAKVGNAQAHNEKHADEMQMMTWQNAKRKVM